MTVAGSVAGSGSAWWDSLMRPSRVLLILCTSILLLAPPLRPAVGEEDPLATPIRALIAGSDPALDRIYRGISKGLEQASLPRIRTEDLSTDAEAMLKRLEAEPPPLLFVVGRLAAQRLGTRLGTVPRVFVDTAWIVNGEPQPAHPLPSPPAAVVRHVTNAARVAEVLRAAWSERPRGVLSWPAEGPVLSPLADALALAAGFDRVPSPEGAQIRLHLRLGAGEVPPTLPSLRAEMAADHLPLLSDDIAHWRRGAAILLLPDHRLLGRVAANEGRRLLGGGSGAEVRRRLVSAPLVHVDLGAAEASGLALPVPFLAGVDDLRDRRPTGAGR